MGHFVQTATVCSKAEAKRWAQDTESAIRHGRYFQILESKRHTLADLIDRYARDVAPRRPRSEDKTSAILRFWHAEFGPYTIADVTPALIGEVQDKLRKPKEGQHGRYTLEDRLSRGGAKWGSRVGRALTPESDIAKLNGPFLGKSS